MAYRIPVVRHSCPKLLRFSRAVHSNAQFDYSPRADMDRTSSFYSRPSGIATPRRLVQYLDEYVIGQENAKKVLSVAVYNHYNRVNANFQAIEVEQTGTNMDDIRAEDMLSSIISADVHPHPRRLPQPATMPIPAPSNYPNPQLEKSNVLVLGPTGSGKTLLARTLAKVLDVPFSVSDATSFTQAGYVGEDVDMCIHRLLQAANWDPYRASMGIVYIDEVDKIARRSIGSGSEGSRDVGGEGVQQALLRMMEGSVVTVPSKGSAAEGPGAAGDSRSRSGQRNPNLAPPRPDMYHIDTTNVLFILSGAFVGLDNIIRRRVAKGSIGFTANLGTPSDDNSSTTYMPFFTSNRTISPNILERVEPVDLVKYGFIPEFISRLPSTTTLSPLTPGDLRRVLTEVRGSLISQYTALFAYSGVEIRFTTGALNAICLRAAERGGGARGLRGIMEQLLLEPMYEAPGSNIGYVLISRDVVQGKGGALYWSQGEGAKFWSAWAEKEAAEE
ncbi:ClpX ATPase regulatory subunit [Dentipellis sp. KUC8613]|nr:ClpX ATPase regulatory subunit [Dentipellis sp. KUC8613]